MRERGSGTRQLFEDYITKHQISVRTVWEANSPRTLLNAALYDQVLSVIWEYWNKKNLMQIKELFYGKIYDSHR